jgi:RimJ/RimL family protein N-acetyltransferase
MNEFNCKFELASEQNYDDYHKIRSEKKNLFWTGYEKPPDYEKFKQWYKNRINDPKKDLYLVYCDNQCVGSLNVDYYEGYVFIGYSVKEQHEGKGYGTFIVKNALEIVKQKPEYQFVRAWINEKNIGSIRVVEKNGFYKTDVSEIRQRFGKNETFLMFEYKI